MTFNSLQYAAFLPAAVLGYWLLPRRLRLAWLLAASYLFYSAWDARFLALIVVSTATDFVVGQRIHGSDQDAARKRWLWLSVAVNLGILGFFKYFDFFVDSAVDLLAQVGIEQGESTLRIVLPVGISFYTFQTMSYSFDVHRRRIEPCRDPLVFATYVAFFPQLVAGPIERAHHLLPQFQSPKARPGYDAMESGLLLIVLGLVKKVVIGDSMAVVVDRAFSDPSAAGSLGMAVGIVAFAIQIYADFSGYTDMARGSARLFGIELVHNFREPYLSRDITEFWGRWHISLSAWLRDYLYVPLGGNRRGPTRTLLNLMITMLLGGLWHGASWNFVIWGGLHGLYLAVHRAWRGRTQRPDTMPGGVGEWSGVAGTFVLVCAAWVFFRSPSLGVAWDVFAALARLDVGSELEDLVLVALMAALTATLDVLGRRRRSRGERLERSTVLTGVALGAAVVALIVFSGGDPVPFVYFQF